MTKAQGTPLRRRLLMALKILISAALLYFIFTLIDVRSALAAAIGVNITLLVLAMLVRLCIFALDALRLSWMKPVVDLPYHQHLRLALRGAFLSQLGFGFLTGDAYRALGYAKGSKGVSGPAAHLLAARLAGITTTALVALIAALYLITSDNLELRGFARQVGLGVSLVGAIILLSLWLGLKVLPRYVPDAVQERLAFGRAALRLLVPRIWAFSMLIVLLRGFSLWLIFIALHQSVPYFVSLLSSVTATLITLLPLAFGGLGLREGAIAGVATLFGTPAAISVSAAILLRITVVSAASAGWVISMFMPEMPDRKRQT